KKAATKPPAVEVRAGCIPESIRDLPRFVCWRWTWKGEQGKEPYWTKPPINPVTGSSADSTDPQTWATLDVALAMVESGKADGIGFVLGDGWCGVDLDDCVDPDSLVMDPWAQAIVNRLDSYTDRSPSMTGCKVLLRGSLPEGRRKMGPVEFYD